MLYILKKLYGRLKDLAIIYSMNNCLENGLGTARSSANSNRDEHCVALTTYYWK